jgi:hypothetical protein
MSSSENLLQQLGYASPKSDDQCHPVRRRRRRSKFDPVRLEILSLWAAGNSLEKILRTLHRRHPNSSLPTSRSQLCRYITACTGDA